MLKQLGFVLDTNKCLGCGACVKACKLNNRLPTGVIWRSIRKIKESTSEGMKQFFLSTACNHCANPECLRVCPSGAYAKRRDGIVIHNTEKCTGCKSCVAACPFSAPQIDSLTNKASKCQLCHDRLERGENPFCVKACLTGALQLQDLSQSHAGELITLTASLPSLRLTRPSVLYTPSHLVICPNLNNNIKKDDK